MSSWPFLFAAALAIWLLLKGPAAKTPLFVQIVCRIAIVFFAYCGVLYLLKWDPFWKWMLSTGFDEPKQGRRLSDPRIDDRLAYCDISYRFSRSPIPRSRRSLRWARESRRATGNESIQPFVEEHSHLPLLLLFLQPQVTKSVPSPVSQLSAR